MKHKRPQVEHGRWGLADFFDTRQKTQILKLMEPKSSDILYDMGCGDASMMIYAVEQAGIKKAVGFENMPSRIKAAMYNIRKHGLKDRITIIPESMYDERFSRKIAEADIIMDQMPEGKDDYLNLYSKHVKDGTKLVKHDLPLIGFVPDKVDVPFYRHTFPLTRAESSSQWARLVLQRDNVTICDVWDEVYYYHNNKAYMMSEIKQFQRLLAARIR